MRPPAHGHSFADEPRFGLLTFRKAGIFRLFSEVGELRLWRKRAVGMLRGLAKPAVQRAREVAIWPDRLMIARGRGPLAVFLPAYGRHGAALLRIHNIAFALRAHGWRTLVLPSTLDLSQRRRLLAAMAPDVVVMQGARHPLNRPAFYPEQRIVYDMDDADFHLAHLAQPVAQAMSEVAGVITGSQYIAQWCRTMGVRADVIWTATPVSARRAVPQSQRPPVVAWAQTAPASYVREAEWVLEVMKRLTARCPDVRLRLYDRKGQGDRDFLAQFENAGIRTEWRPSTKYRDYLASFDDVALGLAPLCAQAPFNRGKSFGKVLAYLDARVPVIASDACEHGRFFDPQSGVVSNDKGVWVDRMAALLADAPARQSMADRAFAQFQSRLSLEEAARRTDQILRHHIEEHTHPISKIMLNSRN